MYYIKQKFNPNKHPLMPDDMPWQSSIEAIEGFDEISEDDLFALEKSFDLTAYFNALKIESEKTQQTEQREHGKKILDDFVDEMGARNLGLDRQNIAINVLSLASDNSGLKLLLETGALKTARGLSFSFKSKYPTHADIYDKLINDITEFLTLRGYE